jgi:hypothetical protein
MPHFVEGQRYLQIKKVEFQADFGKFCLKLQVTKVTIFLRNGAVKVTAAARRGRKGG